jgi:membrane protein implicated in regulation of membrane protease activity
MNFGHFLLAIFAGRFVRFLIEALLTLWFGPGIVAIAGHLISQHVVFILATVGELVGAWLVWRWVKRRGAEKKSAAGITDSAPRGEETSTTTVSPSP